MLYKCKDITLNIKYIKNMACNKYYIYLNTFTCETSICQRFDEKIKVTNALRNGAH